MTNTGIAAKSRGLSIKLIGVEGDPKHIEYAQETFLANGIREMEYTLHRGIAAADSGFALFPRRKEDEERWGSEPRFGVSEHESQKAVASGEFESLPMIPLATAISSHLRIDLLHMDIQGGEADLVANTIPLLSERVARLVIGTHSRVIEGKLIETLLSAGWELEIERPAIFNLPLGKPQTTVDGVQGWRNPRLSA
jgi:hypothetical protein